MLSVLIGCGGAAPEPPRPAVELAAAPPPAAAPTLHLGVEGPVVGWIADGDALVDRHPVEVGDGWLALSLPVWSATGSALVVHARSDALAAPLPALSEPTRRASGHDFTLHLEDGTPVADFTCDEIEVLAEAPDRVRVRVRDERRGWILEGFVPAPLAERGDDDCPPRVLPSPGPVPPGYVLASLPDPVPALDGPVWRMGGEDCQRWEVRATSDGLELDRRTIEAWGRGRAELIETQALGGGPLHYWEYGVSTERRWIREPDPEDGLPGTPGAIGAVFPMTLLSVDEAAITWIEAEGVFAFHPDDVRRWYRSEAACEAALHAPSP